MQIFSFLHNLHLEKQSAERLLAGESEKQSESAVPRSRSKKLETLSDQQRHLEIILISGKYYIIKSPRRY